MIMSDNPPPTLKIGLIGYQFMGRAHSHALRNLYKFAEELPLRPVMRTLCGRDEDALRAVASQYGWERTETSWEAVVSDPEIDAVDIVTPGSSHCDIAVAAAENGKHIICEKPLALTGDEARRMLDAVRANGVKHMVNFNYRRVPAIMLARQWIEEGRIGEICAFSGSYQQDWSLSEAVPFIWRFDRAAAGAGSMADNGSHIIDLARYLAGEFRSVTGRSAIFREERADASGVPQAVSTDDAAVFVAEFANGALGHFHTSRFSAGHKNALRVEINGTAGSIRWDLERMNELEVCFREDALAGAQFQRIMVTESDAHPYIAHWWPPGHIIGWEHTFTHQLFEFVRAIAEDGSPRPDFEDGWRCQLVLDALEISGRSGAWVEV